VESAAVHLMRRHERPPNVTELLTFAARCFAQKRKNLRNNLRPFYGTTIDQMPEARLRAEQLEIEQFGELLTRLNDERNQQAPVH
jgi:16S rRNA A1518/A1519 N6-dimethyltransferase RsmA/KsgA/DIM1 with predicted DNA glycosylase/AP lyase activity